MKFIVMPENSLVIKNIFINYSRLLKSVYFDIRMNIIFFQY